MASETLNTDHTDTATTPAIPLLSVNTQSQMLQTQDPSRLRATSPSSSSSTSRPRAGSTGSPTTPTNATLSVALLRSPSESIGGETLRRPSSAISSHTQYDDIHPDDALKPDNAAQAADFEVEDNPFAFSSGQLNKMLNPKSLSAFKALGGLQGIAMGLQSSPTEGLNADECRVSTRITLPEVLSKVTANEKSEYLKVDPPTHDSSSGNSFTDRIRVYKDNRLPTKKPTSLLELIWNAYKDEILIILTIAAVISLALGIYESLRTETAEDKAEGGVTGTDWIEGVAIMVAIIIVVLVGALNDWQKEKQFVKLNQKKESRDVKVIRSGKSMQISIYDILVGDVMHIEPGDMIPTDGIFISGDNVRCDESSATGESDLMKKTGGDEVWKQIENGTATHKLDPFIISGSKVNEGVGTYMVTSVGVNSSFGKIMMSLRTEVEPTPLQVKLNALAGAIAKLGSAAAGLLFFILLFRFCADLKHDTRSPAAKASNFTDILIVAVTIIVVAVPEGLPLAVTLALAFATTRMLKENNLVRILKSCEIMGNATTICSDKTGTLTQNKMTIVAGTIGLDNTFASSPHLQEQVGGKDIKEATESYSPDLKSILMDSIALNSTAFEGEVDGVSTFVGSKTETAMLEYARIFLGMRPVAQERSDAKIVQSFPFDSGRKCMGVVIKLPSGGYRMYVKGASEIMLASATHYVADASSHGTGHAIALTEDEIKQLNNVINTYAELSLRTIGMLYKDFESWPPAKSQVSEEDPNSVMFESVFQNMILVGIVGIQDPLRDEVIDAVKDCQMAGVKVRMVTGDNVVTAKAIATQCGIYSDGGVVMEGPKFRQLSEEQMMDIIPRLQVLARSSPEDKRILVVHLRKLGETVAVTGDGTNDGPALKAADVGFSMGIAGTEVAKEASAIILMDDNFASIVKAIMWGRAVNDAVRKFLQFQLTVNITAVTLAFVSALSNSTGKSVLTAVQLLWVNLIMDTFAALALATDAPTREILERAPTPKKDALISLRMWKMIIGQAIFQLIVTFLIYYKGVVWFAGILPGDHKTMMLELDTMVFNTFVWMQIFNEFNNRRLDNKFNIFQGMFGNYFFLGINAVMIGGQILIIFIGGQAFSITRLNGAQWGVCLAFASVTLPIGVLIRCIPDAFVAKYWMKIMPFFHWIARGWMSTKRGVRHVVFGPKFMKKWDEKREVKKEQKIEKKAAKKEAKKEAKRAKNDPNYVSEKRKTPSQMEEDDEEEMSGRESTGSGLPAPEITVGEEGGEAKPWGSASPEPDIESGLVVPEKAVTKI